MNENARSALSHRFVRLLPSCRNIEQDSIRFIFNDLKSILDVKPFAGIYCAGQQNTVYKSGFRPDLSSLLTQLPAMGV
ncbi:hypothetical protein, partial [Dechloromonas sp.]|uniref:hypothetical protein n=1 Tax=Dechloromonas sp. TaxID=1917218 RepID=UPI00263F95BB